MSGSVLAAAAAASAASAPASVASAASAAAASASPGFFTAMFAFVAGFLLSWPALIGLALIGVLFEHNGARGWAVTTALVLAASAYFFFAVPLLTILIGAAAYLVAGVAWSVWRYKRYVDKTVEKYKAENEAVRRRVIEALHPKAMLSTLTAWILIWPFSLVENIAGDLINAIQALVTKVFRGVYHSIYNKAVAALNLPKAE